MLIRLLKLPIKLAAFPLIPLLLALHFSWTIVLELSYVITNLLATVFILGPLIAHERHGFRLRRIVEDHRKRCLHLGLTGDIPQQFRAVLLKIRHGLAVCE